MFVCPLSASQPVDRPDHTDAATAALVSLQQTLPALDEAIVDLCSVCKAGVRLEGKKWREREIASNGEERGSGRRQEVEQER